MPPMERPRPCCCLESFFMMMSLFAIPQFMRWSVNDLSVLQEKTMKIGKKDMCHTGWSRKVQHCDVSWTQAWPTISTPTIHVPCKQQLFTSLTFVTALFSSIPTVSVSRQGMSMSVELSLELQQFQDFFYICNWVDYGMNQFISNHGVHESLLVWTVKSISYYFYLCFIF